MKKIIAASAAAVAIAAPLGVVVSAAPAQANTPCATRTEFNHVRVGQSVLTTQQIIGGPGKVTMAGTLLSQRQWRACSGSGAYWVTITYVHGRVDNKIML